MSACSTRKRPRIQSEEELVKDEPHTHADSPLQPNIGSEPENGDPGPQRDAEFWFSDGTVILVAKNVEFRIYGGLLANYSSVFKAMFAEQHPFRLMPINEHQSFPCPVVQLTDSPEDLRHILPVYVSRRQTSPPSTRCPAYIRLGHKYKLTGLYKQSLHLLKRHYTNDLERWIKHDYWRPSHWDTDCYAIGVVNLARLIDEPTLLPTALLACIYMDEDITLALEDLGRCFKAMKDIQQAGVDVVVRTLEARVSQTCETKKSCEGELLLAKVRHFDENRNGFKSCAFPPFDEDPDEELDTCVDCTAMVKERIKEEREKLWNRLPELLDIDVPGWGNRSHRKL
ncbi:hypothetical protein LXA43DRAFT_992563 [Ganoderma leucocontextum]|nr:hypothetical protein LXA43DRAFT_992563 [Ganoderma leucocontextum]